MVKENPYITKMPETYTVSYFDAETGQSFSAEEWKKLNPVVNPSEVRIINQGEVYQSWKINADDPTYGPGLWDDLLCPALKFTGKVVVASSAATAIVASMGTAAPFVAPAVGVALFAGGSAMKDSLEDAPDGILGDTLRGGCELVKDTGLGTFAGGLSSAIGQISSNSLRIARETGDIGEAMVGILGRESLDVIEIGGKLLTIREGQHVFWRHHRHRDNGVYYDPNCLVCKDN